VSANDGIAPGGIGSIPNPKAPEEMYAEYTGEVFPYNDGTNGPIAKGLQPITANNPDGDYEGVSIMSPNALGSNSGAYPGINP